MITISTKILSSPTVQPW